MLQSPATIVHFSSTNTHRSHCSSAAVNSNKSMCLRCYCCYYYYCLCVCVYAVLCVCYYCLVSALVTGFLRQYAASAAPIVVCTTVLIAVGIVSSVYTASYRHRICTMSLVRCCEQLAAHMSDSVYMHA
jgi:hypothetical protein